MITRYINIARVVRLVKYPFSSSFFTKIQTPLNEGDKARPKFTKLQPNRQRIPLQEQDKSRFTSKQNLEYIVNKINESNRYFLGIKHNTNYLKVDRRMKYQEAEKLKIQNVNINDLPIQITKDKQDLTLFDQVNQNDVLGRKTGQIAFSHCRLEPILKQIQTLAKDYILSLASKKRFNSLEPNFQLQNIKVKNSLSDKIVLRLKGQDSEPQIKIKDISLLKGVRLIRNDNYSTDSYSKDQSELGQGITRYILYHQPKQRYPQAEWFSTKVINVRFEVLVKGGPYIQVLDSGNLLGSSENIIHNVVIEADLIPPPAISEHQLTPEEYLRSYRLTVQALKITNFDRKNPFYALTFTEIEKKEVLINGFQ